MKSIPIALLLAASLPAQKTIAPTAEPVGPARGETVGGYNIQNSFELGYRWRAIDGNYGKYRGDVNYGNGIRLLNSSLRVNSLEGHGRLLDELVLNTLGLGNDPYQSASLRIQKNGIYRYDLLWRLNEYYNPGLTIANGQHLLDTRRRFQDHDFTLFPQSAFQLFAGYTRNSQTGPGLSTVQVFDSRGDEFPLFLDVHRRRTEFRLGGAAEMAGFKLNILHGWDRFEDDSPLRLATAPASGNNPDDNTRLDRFERAEPYQGDSPYWRIVLFRNARRFAVNARYANVSGRRDFVFDETAAGANRLGAAQNRQITVAGTGSRPSVSGSLNLTLLPTGRITITNHTAFHNTRMDGDATYREFNNGTAGLHLLNFQHLGIRAIQTLTDATVSLAAQVDLYGGYHYSTRRIRSREGSEFGSGVEEVTAGQDNRIHSALAGLRLRPAKGVTLQVDGEMGRASRPFFPVSEKRYYAYGARLRYKTRSMLFGSSLKSFQNANSVSLFAHSSRTLQSGADFSWNSAGWLSLNASYSYFNIDTATGLAYFAGGLVSGRSYYLSNLHTGTLGAQLTLGKRADMFLGYSIVRDTGDGRPAASVLNAISSDPFYAAQTFPLRYQSPQARLSLRLHNRLRWNAGYQFYGYHEDFFQATYQNYRAHTGYTSLLWSF